MKLCKKCNKTKSLENFCRRGKGHQPYCKECNSSYHKSWYAKNGQYVREDNSNRRSKYRDETSQWIYEYLKAHPCVDCGETNPVKLEFDHVRGDKEFEIADGKGNYSLATIKQEVEKCEVRCASCHRMKTARDFKWKIFQLFEEETKRGRLTV